MKIIAEAVGKKLNRHKNKELKNMAQDFPSLYLNTARILASIKMLEMNISDIKNLWQENRQYSRKFSL